MKVGIIGYGCMGKVIADAMSLSHEVFVCGRNKLQTEKDIEGTNLFSVDVEELISISDIIWLCVKPCQVESLVKSNFLRNKSISMLCIAAKISLEQLINWNSTIRWTLVMPNLALKVNQGMFGIFNPNIDNSERELLENLLNVVGICYWFEEITKYEAFTQLCGCGIAWLLLVFESMVDASIGLGFKQSEAIPLVVDLWKSSGSLFYSYPDKLTQLKWDTCSPGGLTIQGIHSAEKNGLRTAIIETFMSSSGKHRIS